MIIRKNFNLENSDSLQGKIYENFCFCAHIRKVLSK